MIAPPFVQDLPNLEPYQRGHPLEVFGPRVSFASVLSLLFGGVLILFTSNSPILRPRLGFSVISLGATINESLHRRFGGHHLQTMGA